MANELCTQIRSGSKVHQPEQKTYKDTEQWAKEYCMHLFFIDECIVKLLREHVIWPFKKQQRPHTSETSNISHFTNVTLYFLPCTVLCWWVRSCSSVAVRLRWELKKEVTIKTCSVSSTDQMASACDSKLMTVPFTQWLRFHLPNHQALTLFSFTPALRFKRLFVHSSIHSQTFPPLLSMTHYVLTRPRQARETEINMYTHTGTMLTCWKVTFTRQSAKSPSRGGHCNRTRAQLSLGAFWQ